MKKLPLLFAGLLVTAILFAGCSSGDTSNGNGDTFTGDIIAGGSTSTKNIMEATGEEFSALNPDVNFEYNTTGSSDGVKGANDGTYMLGTASREVKEDEKAWKLTEKIFAYDGIAVVTHPSNKVTDVTEEQIAQIYKGEITNWSEIGGADAPIVVVSREDGSGTRGAFEELLGFEEGLTQNATIAEGNGNVQSTVAGNENAIGYVSFTYIDDTVKALTVEGVAPTVEDVLNKTYPISRPFVMIYHEDNLSDAAKAYIDFLMSADGQLIVEDEGGIPVE